MNSWSLMLSMFWENLSLYSLHRHWKTILKLQPAICSKICYIPNDVFLLHNSVLEIHNEIYNKIFKFFFNFYSAVFASAIQEHEWPIIINIFPPSWTSIPSHPTPLGDHRAPVLCSNFSPATHPTHSSAYILMLHPWFVPRCLSIPDCVHISILYICVSIHSFQIGSSIPFF